MMGSALTGMMSGPAAVVSVGSTFGMGGKLLQIPLSQLNYDQSNQRITMSVAQSDLTSLLQSGETSRSAAE
jgi:hypothetical protein